MQVSRTQAPLFTPPQRGGSWGTGGGHCRAFPGVPPLRHTAQRHCPSPPPLGGSQAPHHHPQPHPSPRHLAPWGSGHEEGPRAWKHADVNHPKGNMLTSTIPKPNFSACYQITISCDISPSTMAQSPSAFNRNATWKGLLAPGGGATHVHTRGSRAREVPGPEAKPWKGEASGLGEAFALTRLSCAAPAGWPVDGQGAH